ncbi:YczE/YyaS/YitT family protein [Alkalihalobacterium chitinilyticum]|uniref:YitT family protein n=1 Tax=Alkalihalobacterium chitinilyticum TaxID=2980103 RepID=A0ABT5VG70_9BACI|nr:YitT family protein [Alkalihalobacterium chitinilyticum]MDE5413727.1 YitT family protein [Alkalihalobacterium chitinilyticum]
MGLEEHSDWKRKKLGLRWGIFMLGLVIMSFGIALMITADLGSAPWDVLHIGLTLQLGLTIGTWSIIMGFVIIGVTTLLTKEWPQVGAFVNMVLVGVFIDIFLFVLSTPSSFIGKLIMLVSGIIIIGYGIGLYIAPKCGAGPRDSLMLAITEKTKLKVQWVRSAMEIVVLTTGWLLGGPVFIGTLIFCFGIGSVVGITLPQCQRLVDRLIERGVNNEDINKGTLRVNHHDGISKEIR